jgi:hypothetical protein
MRFEIRFQSRLQRLLTKIRQMMRRKPRPANPEPEDPYAYRMAPFRRPPSKGGAAAVAELDED